LQFFLYDRNEVWRFDPQFGIDHSRKLFIRNGTMGMKWGFLLFVGVALIETAYKKAFGKGDAHGHGHGHGHH
jgi:hypothetical protein